MLDPSLNMSGDPALSQTGGGSGSGGEAHPPAPGAAKGGSEFGKEPPQVQAAADGSTGRRSDEARKDDSREDDEPKR
jgi:hypothetical protein